MQHILPELPYPKNALEPYISAETLEYHHGKHHRAYVNKLNELIQGTEFENKSLEEIILTSSGPIFNNAAQVWNHTFYWNCLAPKGNGGEPKGEFLKALERDFGSVQNFLEQFQKAGIGQFGSGWAWLVRNDSGKLAIEATSNAQNPLQTKKKPILTWDVWEHAYYIDYRNDRAKHLQSITQIINWEFANRNFLASAELAA